MIRNRIPYKPPDPNEMSESEAIARANAECDGYQYLPFGEDSDDVYYEDIVEGDESAINTEAVAVDASSVSVTEAVANPTIIPSSKTKAESTPSNVEKALTTNSAIGNPPVISKSSVKPSDMHEWLKKNVEFVLSTDKSPYIRYGNMVYSVKSKEFHDFCDETSLKIWDSVLSPQELEICQRYASGYARINDNVQELYRRVGYHEGDIVYAYVGDMGHCVRINPKGVAKDETPPIFAGNPDVIPQVAPFLPGNVHLMRSHINLKYEMDYRLLIVHLCLLFIPRLQTPILILTGSQGSAKTTLLAMIKAIADKSVTMLRTQHKELTDLAIALNKEHFTAFDNLSEITNSDTLCSSVTGGVHTARELYTNFNEVRLILDSRVGITATNLVVKAPDLLDRCLNIKLSRIEDKKRIPHNEVWKRFNADLPTIFGGVLTTISRAMAIEPTLAIPALPRMAEYAKWGCAVAEALGFGWEQYLRDFQRSTFLSTRESLQNDSFCYVVMAYMDSLADVNIPSIEGTPTVVYKDIKTFSLDGKIDRFPMTPSAFIRRLNEKKAILKEIGVYIENGYKHGHKHIVLSTKPIETVMDGDMYPLMPFNADDNDFLSRKDDARLPFEV